MNENMLNNNSYNVEKKRTPLKVIGSIIILVVLVFVLLSIFSNKTLTASKAVGSSVTINAPNTDSKPIPVNRIITISLVGLNSPLNYSIETAEKINKIIIKGQNASAAPGKIFLILNLKIKNANNQGVQINTRDFVRLSVNGDSQNWLAPEIYNDPVEVQAISTKQTRLGFAINTTDKKLQLKIGQINGPKEITNLTF